MHSTNPITHSEQAARRLRARTQNANPVFARASQLPARPGCSALATLDLCDLADQKPLLSEEASCPHPVLSNVERPTENIVQRLAHDPHGSHLINFPFALMVFLLLLVGALVMSAGLVAPNAGATVSGFLICLLGAILYCGRLADE